MTLYSSHLLMQHLLFSALFHDLKGNKKNKERKFMKLFWGKNDNQKSTYWMILDFLIHAKHANLSRRQRQRWVEFLIFFNRIVKRMESECNLCLCVEIEMWKFIRQFSSHTLSFLYDGDDDVIKHTSSSTYEKMSLQ